MQIITQNELRALIRVKDPSLEENVRFALKPSLKQQLPIVMGFKVKARGKGEIHLNCCTNHGNWSYRFEYKQVTNDSQKGNNNWVTIVTSHSYLLLGGLESGKEYAFRAALVCFNSIGDYCEEIRSFVLPI